MVGFLLYFERVITITVIEYVEKYYTQLASGDPDETTLAAKLLLNDLASEMGENLKRRRITKSNAQFVLMCETNTKWNKIVESLEKKIGRSTLKKDGFKIWYNRMVKEVQHGISKT